jgi:protein TonB
VDYAQAQRNPGKHLSGFAIVVVLHVILGYALVAGLGRKIVEVIKAPIETKIIEEVKPPPPPPPSFVPPPEVQIANPPPAPAITVTREAPPPAPPVALAPPPAPVPPPPAPVAPRQAVAAQINVNACEKPEYPAAAARAEATGTTKIRFTVDAAGKVSKADIEKSSGSSREHRQLDNAAKEALSKCPFKPGTDENGKPVGATTLVEYVWKLE